MERAIAVRPDDPRPYRHLHTYHERAGREREAIAVLERGRRALPQDGSILLRLAWSLATSPSATLRDPQRALTLARRIAGSTDHPKVQDTLAAALAANGSFRQAAEQAGQALLAAESAGDVELARAIRARVSLYESGKPYVR